MKKLSFIILALVLACCTKRTPFCKLKVQYIEQFDSNGITSYAHTLYVDDTMIPENELIRIAQRYIDSIPSEKPVFVISFLSSVDGLPATTADEDLGTIRERKFLTLHYHTPNGEQGKLYEITRKKKDNSN